MDLLSFSNYTYYPLRHEAHFLHLPMQSGALADVVMKHCFCQQWDNNTALFHNFTSLLNPFNTPKEVFLIS